MQRFQALPLWLRQTLIGLGLFVAGGLFAFGYSYRPLHGARIWQIQRLESRLEVVNRENLALHDELAQLRSATSDRVDPGTLAQVERELEKTKAALARAEKGLESSEARRRELASKATRWQRRYEELRDAPAPAPDPAAASSARPRLPNAADDPSLRAPGGAATADVPPASPSASASPVAPAPPSLPSPEAPGNAMLVEEGDRPLP
jgi:hypothetical protein